VAPAVRTCYKNVHDGGIDCASTGQGTARAKAGGHDYSIGGHTEHISSNGHMYRALSPLGNGDVHDMASVYSMTEPIPMKSHHGWLEPVMGIGVLIVTRLAEQRTKKTLADKGPPFTENIRPE
jgi:hypothetical protein